MTSSGVSQFETNAKEYRCCCECCHVKTGAILVGVVEVVFLLYFLISSLVLVSQTGAIDSVLSAGGTNNPAIIGPFAACLSFLGLAIIVLILLFTGLLRKSPAMLLPHIVLQIIAIVLFFCLIICASLALATDLTIFYRILNIVAFAAPPDTNTVSLSLHEKVPVYIGLIVYILGALLELWFTFIIYWCYRYFAERADYIKYVRQYSVPLNSVPYSRSSVPQYTPR